jgi:Cdc6-like AAA superfamily ATPase
MAVPKAFIKDIAISVSEEYSFNNSPLHTNNEKALLRALRFTKWRRCNNKKYQQIKDTQENAQRNKEQSFIGRKKIKEKFLQFLESGNKRGVFLVTGYRGMGKTSFVNHVLSKYLKRSTDSKHNPGIFVINITIAQKQPQEIDILRLMMEQVCEEAKIHSRRYRFRKFLSRAITYSLILLLIPALYFFFEEKVDVFMEMDKEMWPFPWWEHLPSIEHGRGILKIMGFVAVSLIFIFSSLRLLVKQGEAFVLLQKVFKRCYASSNVERDQEHESGLQSLLGRIIPFTGKEITSFPVASAKEIEMALAFFLENVENEYIFVFDELDKMESTRYNADGEIDGNIYSDTAYHEQIRERKQAVITIIAGLKNFLTTAKARFIFIAGREMFDATLADISDRQSSLGSMFSYVFYVESFLKESMDNKHTGDSLSGSIEAYLCHVLFNDFRESSNLYEATLNELIKKRDSSAVDKILISDAVINKILISLQNFVIYLTYRSNGSPQKIIKAVHEFIRKDDVYAIEEVDYIRINDKSDKFLYFNFNDQYRIGFISYLYRPFLIEYGRSFKHYSDSIVASTPYLFDHLLKFHPFAFSFSHLELIPEVLSANKLPSVRTHIKSIIEYLSKKHLRETEVGLFEYKFISRTLNEITFLSRTFEAEAAAFNFTLDESYAIKLHVRNKIRAKKGDYLSNHGASGNSCEELFSINYLQTMLGDLHFFDQEYHDAVIAYADAVRSIEHIDFVKMKVRDFVTLINTRLKLGLAFERMQSYTDAIPCYSDAIEDVKQFFLGRLKKPIGDSWEGIGDEPASRSAILFDILQLVNQCFLANIVIQEKMGIAGISIRNLEFCLRDFFSLSEKIAERHGENTLINANMILVSANLLYFKNSDRVFQDIFHVTIKEIHSLNKLREANNSAIVFQETAPAKDIKWSTLSLYCFGLIRILEVAGTSFEDCNKNSIVIYLLQLFDEDIIWSNRLLAKNDFKYIGIFLSNIGDTLLTQVKNKRGNIKFKLSDIFVESALKEQRRIIELYYIERLKEPNPESNFNSFPKKAFLDCLNLEDETNKEYNIGNVLKCYFQSGYSFMKRGRKFSTSFQYRKILYVLRLVLGEKSTEGANGDFIDNFLYVIEHTIVRSIILIAGQNNSHTDGHMINKYKSFLQLKDVLLKQKFLEYHISYHPELKEADILFNYIKIQVGKKDNTACELLVNNYTSLGTQYIRILELDLFVKATYSEVLAADNNLKEGLGQTGLSKIKEDCIDVYKNYLYGMLTIIRLLEIYETDYMLGYTYRAYIHFRIAQFLSSRDDFAAEIKASVTRIKQLSEYRSSYIIDDSLHHFSMAKKFYVKSIQLHTQGTEYRYTIDDMIYLEDDINDNAYHFGAALERYLNNNEIIREYISICDKHLKRENDDILFPDNGR